MWVTVTFVNNATQSHDPTPQEWTRGQQQTTPSTLLLRRVYSQLTLVGGTAVLTEKFGHKAMQSPDQTPHGLNQSRQPTLTPSLVRSLLTASKVIAAQRVGRQPVRLRDVGATLLS